MLQVYCGARKKSRLKWGWAKVMEMNLASAARTLRAIRSKYQSAGPPVLVQESESGKHPVK